MAVGVRQAPRGRLGAPPVLRLDACIFNVRRTHRFLRTALLRARVPSKNYLHRKGTELEKRSM
jgi:hypothetical protein